MQLCIMPRLLTHLVQESKVGTVDVRMVPIQRKQEIALKEQIVRCHCKTRCVTEHSTCRRMWIGCTVACGSSKGDC